MSGRRLKSVVLSFLEWLIRDIPGGIGERVRSLYYSRVLGKCGVGLRVSEGVIFENPSNIFVGDNVWFLPFSIITGSSGYGVPKDRIHKKKIKKFGDFGKKLIIGNQVSIGAYNIIHGFGGLKIGNYVTTSARVSIYSHSHMPSDPDNPEVITYSNSMVLDGPVACISSAISIEDGVWLGLNSAVFGGSVGKNSFVKTNSVVTRDIPDNVVAEGNPAVGLRPRFRKKAN